MGVGGCHNLERPPQHLHTAQRPDVDIDKITAFNYKEENEENEVSYPANLRTVTSDFGWVSQVQVART